MGRPIKKSFIGNTSSTGQQIVCYAWVPGDSQARLSYIDEQTGTGRYHVVSTSGAHEGVVTLANVNSGNLIVGQASIAVSPYEGGTKYAKVIYDNTVRTFDESQYKWYFTGTSLTEVNSATIQSA